MIFGKKKSLLIYRETLFLGDFFFFGHCLLCFDLLLFYLLFVDVSAFLFCFSLLCEAESLLHSVDDCAAAVGTAV